MGSERERRVSQVRAAGRTFMASARGRALSATSGSPRDDPHPCRLPHHRSRAAVEQPLRAAPVHGNSGQFWRCHHGSTGWWTLRN